MSVGPPLVYEIISPMLPYFAFVVADLLFSPSFQVELMFMDTLNLPNRINYTFGPCISHRVLKNSTKEAQRPWGFVYFTSYLDLNIIFFNRTLL